MEGKMIGILPCLAILLVSKGLLVTRETIARSRSKSLRCPWLG
ncbi:MAG: hypothetical protein QXI39_02745 [Candidatus Bathyarchaeia archaeon]